MLGNCFGSDVLKKTTVYEWHERFRSGRESVEDNERSGRPSTSKTDENINKVREMLANNRKLTIRELAEDLNIAYGSVQDIVVNDLGLRRVAAKLVPKELNFMQKRDRVDIAKYMISKTESDPTFIITGDETWVYEYDTQSKHQASEWRAPNEPRPKKPRRFQSKKKAMLTVFMNYNGIVHHEFLSEEQSNEDSSKEGHLKERTARTPAVVERTQALISDDPEQSLRVLMDVVKPWLETIASGKPYPPIGSDLNPLDYYVWSVVEIITNKSQHANMTLLRHFTIEALFVGITACVRTLQGIKAIIQANGGYIE
ncbi:PREDICTED: uncharacterized protein LOC105146071 [Acromyrmex echinatior]|uniref:uncharacterized protein LOC105146071 n=1 Tax=Acromyrmex echinatior TaxID=103372 RepID=UPI000580FEF9|nr:PREDICTED: uncharacterized protein LOC105146071 [Acromyrmex echinatior]